MSAGDRAEAAEARVQALEREVARLTEQVAELRTAVEKYDENDSDTAYYDAKEVCNAARAFLQRLT